jgi:hypothetical protein
MHDDERDLASDPRRTPAERALQRRLEDNPRVGRPLSERARQAQRSVEGYLKGGNPPRWMERIAEIDQRIARERRELAERYEALRARHADDGDAFARGWRELAQARDYTELNELIRQHNEWFPVERNLAVDPRTGDYLPVHGRSHRRRPLDLAWVLEQFPDRP